jgi:hypothetical protein
VLCFGQNAAKKHSKDYRDKSHYKTNKKRGQIILDNLTIGFLFGLTGSIVGTLITHFLSKSRRNEENFKKAATKFKCAFLPEIIYLRHNANIGRGGSPSDLGEYLRGTYLRHLEAITVFMDSLTNRQKSRVNEAWQVYCHHQKNKDELNFEQYSHKAPGKTNKDIIHSKALALERIEKLLKIAE